ncbi:MAG: hypothetical protein WCO56_14915 [Verrucomicrobiota bacterium]
MKKYAEQFGLGVAKGLGYFVVAPTLGTWILLHIPRTREGVIEFLFRLAPPSRALLPISLALFLLGILCILGSYRLFLFRKKQRLIEAEAMLPRRTSGAFTSEDIKSMELSKLPPDPNDPIDHDACNVRLDKDFFG